MLLDASTVTVAVCASASAGEIVRHSSASCERTADIEPPCARSRAGTMFYLRVGVPAIELLRARRVWRDVPQYVTHPAARSTPSSLRMATRSAWHSGEDRRRGCG